MLTLGPVIGKLGGGVESIPVDFVSPSSSGVYDVVAVPAPEGVATHVVVATETTNVTGTNQALHPQMIIDGVELGSVPVRVASGVSLVVHGPTHVQVTRKATTNAYDPSFTGAVYYWPAE